MGRSTVDDQWIAGRMGFEQEEQTEFWDEDAMDFGEGAVRRAQTVPFTVDSNTLRVAFQLRGSVVRPGTFRGAFQRLLNEASPYWQWAVRLEGVSQPPWDEWIGTVDRLTSLKIHMERPNPRYRREQVRELFEKTKAAAIEIALEAEPDGALGTDEELIEAALEHAQDYGRVTATGVVLRDGKALREPWRSSAEGAVAKTSVAANPETGEALPAAMRDALEQDDGDDGTGERAD
jgi:hypothetical protein